MFISKKYYHIVFASFMSLIMCAIISFVGLLSQLNSTAFLYIWLSTWGKSYLVSFPISLVISPLIRKIADKLTY